MPLLPVPHIAATGLGVDDVGYGIARQLGYRHAFRRCFASHGGHSLVGVTVSKMASNTLSTLKELLKLIINAENLGRVNLE